MYISSHILQTPGEKGAGKGREKRDVCKGQRLPLLRHTARVAKIKVCNSVTVLTCNTVISSVFIFTAHMPLLCPCRAQELSVDGQDKLPTFTMMEKVFPVFVKKEAAPLSYI